MLCSTSNRLKLLASAYSNVERIVTSKEVQNNWNKLLGVVGLAAATSTFILGWDESEYDRVLGWVRGRKEVTDVVQGLRIFLWEFIDHEDTKASWLSYIISTFGMPFQQTTHVDSRVAEVLYLFLGPSLEIETDDPTLTMFQQNTINRLQSVPSFSIMQEKVPENYEEAKRMFSDLGRGLRLLLRSPTISTHSGTHKSFPI